MELRRRRSRCVGLICAVVVADLALLIGCVAPAFAQSARGAATGGLLDGLGLVGGDRRKRRQRRVALGTAGTSSGAGGTSSSLGVGRPNLVCLAHVWCVACESSRTRGDRFCRPPQRPGYPGERFAFLNECDKPRVLFGRPKSANECARHRKGRLQPQSQACWQAYGSRHCSPAASPLNKKFSVLWFHYGESAGDLADRGRGGRAHQCPVRARARD